MMVWSNYCPDTLGLPIHGVSLIPEQGDELLLQFAVIP